ncbi:hypothetical protein LNAOJCKE_4518 [Methylorubrum aminovorans]|uniref:Methyltransferase FkbM domain-containing protein n=2 Tax=Methylorubrum aminovorans TaxID=269069 RepID=A0ABQ4UJ77_9HYPH|nr:hypothetical protein LNAOJCKE_4518 [Methylorubrum aminovorans]
MLLKIAGQEVEFSGSDTDDYFKSLQTHANSFDDLIQLASRVPADAVIFDVGANIGVSAAIMALVKPAARIFAFEPSPANIGFLRQNTARFPNVTVVEAAASHKPGTLHFHMSDYGAGSHVVTENHITLGMPVVDVPAIRLDDYANEHALRPALIKLDVEGHEPEVLAGAGRILSEERPFVHMEFNTWTLNAYAGHSPAAFAQALWHAFDVEVHNNPKPNSLTFLHDHFVKDHCFADLIMKPKAGVPMPTYEEMSFSPAAREAISAARQLPR